MMQKGNIALGIIMIILGSIMLYTSIANIKIAPVIIIIIGAAEMLLGIVMLTTKKK